MSMNIVFGFSLFLLILVGLNVYFFYTLTSVGKKPANFFVPGIKIDSSPNEFKNIYDFLNYLPSQYRVKNPKFFNVQKNLIRYFNYTKPVDAKAVWREVDLWASEESLLPFDNGAAGRTLHTIRTAQIVFADNAPKGTQLKLLFILEGKQKLFFKPKRYHQNDVIKGSIYAGFDRHNSEVFAYYLAMVLDFKWIAPSVIRKVNFYTEILPYVTLGLKRTMVKKEDGSVCVYGKCFYCRANETVCPEGTGQVEGAAILYLERNFRVHKSPWRRSYGSRRMEWQIDAEYCKKVTSTLSLKRVLDLVDVSIFDFLIQNGDRHRYEVYKDRVVLLDNGKGLGNPTVDELDILAPLYQCCMLSTSTWQRLELISGGSLTDTIKILSSYQGASLATEDHYRAVERRLLKVYATIQYCIGKYGSAKVFKDDYY